MTAESAASAAPDAPAWNLADLYDGPQSQALADDLEQAERRAAAFAETYHGRVADLDGAAFGEAVRAYEALSDLMGRIGSYAQLRHAQDVTDPEIGRFYQNVQEKLTEATTCIVFFTVEINELTDEQVEALTQHPAVAPYAPWLRDVRVFRDHQLPEAQERLLHEKEVTGRGAWTRLFDETMAALRFDVDGESLTETEVLDRLSSPDRETRRKAGQAFGAGLADNQRLFTHITNTLAKDKAVEDRWRGFDDPAAERHLLNQVEPEVVDALVRAVRDSHEPISHRYYRLKARWLGLDTLEYYDRNAPVPGEDDRRWGWSEARRTVLDAYHRFSPDMAGVAGRFFDNAWIDAEARAGKASGAFSHPVTPSAHPYILLNYMGKARDVMTLAHELGHGVHQMLAADQGALMADTPLTLAETASVFGEMLTFQALLAAEQDPARRRALLAHKIEDMLNTVVRQVAFYDFERRVHLERREGEVSAERIGQIWLEEQERSLGPAFRFADEYRHYWSYVPHFLHAPFYVYAYAFGDCLVNALYAVYEDGHPAFQDKYLDMLRAGGSKRHHELLAPFGLDARDPAFWRRGLDVIADLVDRLEKELEDS